MQQVIDNNEVTEVSMTRKRRKRSENYVDPKKFYEAIKDYKARCKAAIAEDQKKPRIPEYIGECIHKIATNLIKSYKFNNKYAFEDQMVSDAQLQCLEYLNTFDPERSTSAFSFFTQTCYNRFILTIKTEKKEMYIRTRMMIDMPANGELADVDDDDHSMDNVEVAYENMHEFVREYEEKNGLNKARKKRVKNSEKESVTRPKLGIFNRGEHENCDPE